MSDLFPEDQRLHLFSRRFVQQMYDPTAIRPIISPGAQARPKVFPSIEAPVSRDTPPNRFVQSNSPKRPLPLEESDNEAGRPRKLARGESPLKGAAGRRLDQQKRNRQPHEMLQFESHSLPQAPPPPPIPRDVLFLLSIIPKAETYHATKFKAEEMVRLIRETNIPKSVNQLSRPPISMGAQPMQGMHGMPQTPQMPQVSQMPPRPPLPQMHQMQQMPPGQYNGGYSNFSSSSDHFTPTEPSPLPFLNCSRNFETQNSQVMGYETRLGLQDRAPLRACYTNQNMATVTSLISTLPLTYPRNPSAPPGAITTHLNKLSNGLQRNPYNYRS